MVLCLNSGKNKEQAWESIEAAFRLPGFRGLQLTADNWEDKADSFLAHAVARNPGDLYAHVQRINLNISRKDIPSLFGSLLDLFIALGDAGFALRKRMFGLSKNLLEKQPRRFLSAALKAGINATSLLPADGVSVLAMGFSGVNELVKEVHQTTNGFHSPLEVANSYIEFGQLQEARQLLEKTVLDDTLTEEVQQLLLEIYRKTNNQEDFLKTFFRLRGKPGLAYSVWQATAEFLGCADEG